MPTLIVKTENEKAAKLLLAFLSNLRLVKSITRVKDKTGVVSEPEGEYNWTNPSRPATDEEIDKMLDECETGAGVSSKEARRQTMKYLKEWERKRKK